MNQNIIKLLFVISCIFSNVSAEINSQVEIRSAWYHIKNFITDLLEDSIKNILIKLDLYTIKKENYTSTSLKQTTFVSNPTIMSDSLEAPTTTGSLKTSNGFFATQSD